MRKGDGAALLARLLEIAGLDLDSLAREIATSPLGARVAAKYVGALGEDGVEKLLGTPEMRQTMRAISDSIGASLARALAPQLEQFNASSRTTLATLLNATGFDDSARRLSEQLVSSEAVLSLSRSWAKTFSQSVVFDPEMIATVRAARQATTDE
ncbi:hypothetical protein SAMN04515669_5378 [Jiangella sp. DSM 45060]|nr:hypothetical protein SAMN04515669_5378 [Jiangella sp. DSM 45060]